VTVKVICHPVTGKSKGYGFVKYSSETEAAAALEKMRDEVNRTPLDIHSACCSFFHMLTQLPCMIIVPGA
jgi:RNA recognition motif-containing protein